MKTSRCQYQVGSEELVILLALDEAGSSPVGLRARETASIVTTRSQNAAFTSTASFSRLHPDSMAIGSRLWRDSVGFGINRLENRRVFEECANVPRNSEIIERRGRDSLRGCSIHNRGQKSVDNVNETCKLSTLFTHDQKHHNAQEFHHDTDFHNSPSPNDYMALYRLGDQVPTNLEQSGAIYRIPLCHMEFETTSIRDLYNITAYDLVLGIDKFYEKVLKGSHSGPDIIHGLPLGYRYNVFYES
ncbi:hypothetical protein K504DRAFT_539419 [Pleomassaria siparia CBS 279.74]|uniref:Uncharacterized protein n=1 Tax=Pleomassaria siparia CBS 279.74 TaxID=1314801 RepID=A0A6G1JRC8_9PLEO|nr:hypothetical protein K504DRAFT_539419 [Pleomassaria siparia CBS 279.74]